MQLAENTCEVGKEEMNSGIEEDVRNGIKKNNI